jgi:hypothetical protein
MPDTSKNFPPTQDLYARDVGRVAEFVAQRLIRGRSLSEIIYEVASEFPGVRLSVFNDALAQVYARAGSDGFPAGRVQ